ncbi:fluoride efflux transporter FluC [Leuconostoc citreum]|uniref:fluoride efflux transporter FluC n=1 Tax=Leuconostoc citreum TaxID=33964 RepID=UPI002181F903|nr:CrcB family protein [Leuconostoc citreum]MCS8582897.1 CrcB family protein [Leuconostoc citreum]MCS8601258.1 CrcB family protein [Leuconostoc citreum]
MKYFYLYIGAAVASGLGSLIRYLIISFTPVNRKLFTGVFLVNMMGSFLMGWLSVTMLSNEWRIFIGTGLIGGITTFSTMMTQGEQLVTLKQRSIYFLSTLCLGIFLFLIGAQLK